MNRKVFIVSLPRHGTSSLERFLYDHGIHLAHNLKLRTDETKENWNAERLVEAHRSILAGSIDLPLLSECDGLSMYPVSTHYLQLAERYPDSLFIHVERDRDGWLESAEGYLNAAAKSRGNANPPLNSAFAYFRKALFGCDAFDRESYSQGYDRHYDKLEQFSQLIGKERFISISLAELSRGDEATLGRLFDFLGVDRDPSIEFPHVTSHTLRYLGQSGVSGIAEGGTGGRY